MRLLYFIGGAITGAYVAQNYEVPPVAKLLKDNFERIKAMFPPKEE